ncbi:UDP-3-O-(3-hydroxymyristoyl)glucosamine N-acyltransferase [Plasticicumulans sp.]|uniref:UDP-3-O-(3-hydroxymyristoyl)glucosamine N-acyltransferase n=1 Tax=Plasticicumulans sp. TaxID=2307179 RepID=UPI002CA4C6C5|nr:UDP-3-O-(3-hydroxymyristoyl)glucosamine N-acyltransferase [Plasticicumulans sp.]
MHTLAELAQVAGAQLRGDAATPIDGVGTLAAARPGQIGFLANPKYRQLLAGTQASAVILGAEDAGACPVACLIADNPHLAYARVAALFDPAAGRQQGVHARACVDAAAEVADDAWIGPMAVIEAGAVIGPRVQVGPGCVVGARTSIGADSRLVANVTVLHDCVLGERVLVHPGAVIGADGFGLANDRGCWVKVPQLGRVVIGNDVEIGVNTAVDRGALEDTVLADGVKLDNLIQIAHNVRVGAHTAMAGCVGIAGSTTVGAHCTLAGGVGLAGHLTLGDHVHVTGMSLVTKSLTEPGVYASGLAVEPARLWNKVSARLRRLDELFRRLAALEKRVGDDAGHP